MDSKEIKELIQVYFDANYETDANKITKVFHENANVYGHDEKGNYGHMDKTAFLKLIDSLPADPSAPRKDELLSLDFIGGNAAVARVRIRMGNMIYTDILNFIRLEGKWGIVTKIYSGTLA